MSECSLSVGSSGRLLWMQKLAFGFHAKREISRVNKWLLDSQWGLCSLALVNVKEHWTVLLFKRELFLFSNKSLSFYWHINCILQSTLDESLLLSVIQQHTTSHPEQCSTRFRTIFIYLQRLKKPLAELATFICGSQAP